MLVTLHRRRRRDYDKKKELQVIAYVEVRKLLDSALVAHQRKGALAFGDV